MRGHEGGDFALHYGDEYFEEGEPEARPRGGVSRGMASRNMSSLALLHERHFAFAPVFVNRIMELFGPHLSCLLADRPAARYPGCLLDALQRVPGLAPRAGDVPRPGASNRYGFTRGRELESIVGLHARMLVELEDEGKLAFLLGARAGLEGTIARALREGAQPRGVR